jgi:predicted nucleic acid-binding protein
MARDVSPALTLWSLVDVTLVSSAYAIDEAERNLDAADARSRLDRLLRQIEIVDEAPETVTLPKRIELALNDRPILLAAIHAKCSHLLTGDHKRFGALFGRSVKGVRVVTVREYLSARNIREGP